MHRPTAAPIWSLVARRSNLWQTPQPSRYLVVMDDQALATARKIDEQLRMLRYERERTASMPNMGLNIERIDERINRLERERAELIEGTGKDQAPL